MEIVENIFGSLTRAIGLIIFAASAMFVGWAAFQYMTAQGDPQAQMKARNQMIGVGIAMVLGGFAGFAPGFFNDLILRPAGIGVEYGNGHLRRPPEDGDQPAHRQLRRHQRPGERRGPRGPD